MGEVAVRAMRRSPRGNWLVVRYEDHEIRWCRWVHTWAGAQMSKRNSEQYVPVAKDGTKRGCVIIMDIEKMAHFAVTEAADEINDLYKLFEK